MSAAPSKASARHVVVVGGGAIGVCSAWYLAQRGVRVTLLERNEVGDGCSYGNAGLVVPSHCVPLAAPGAWQQGLRWMFRPNSPFRVKPRLDLRLLRWLWQFRAACTPGHVERSLPVLRNLSYASLALWDELDAIPGLEFGYRKAGMLLVFRTPHGFEEGTREASLLQRHGVTNQVLSARVVLAAEPSLDAGVTGGVFFPDDAQLVPDRFVKGLASVARERGVEIRTAAEVTGFETRADRVVSVLTAAGRVEADELVLAAGSASARLGRALGLRLPVEGGKGYSVTVEPPGDGGPRTPLILAEDRLAATPMAGRLRLSGTLELAGEDRTVDRRRAVAVLSAARRWFRHPPVVDAQSAVWSGLRPCTPDGLPLVGRPRRYANLIVATGHAMLGVSLSPITGRLVSDLLADPHGGRTGPLQPDRFNG